MSGTGIDGAVRERLRRALRAETRRGAQPEVDALVEALRARYGASFRGALYYGSCRRQTIVEGLVDLHVLVDDPVAALGPVQGRLCAALPPNVYFLEIEHDDRRVACKFAVLSAHRFRRSCTRRAFHSYFWARYAQPMTVLGVDDEEREALEESLVDALATLASRALPILPDCTQALDFWERTLALCYACELRPERGNRSAVLVEGHGDYYEATGRAVLDARRSVLAARSPAAASTGWALRRAWGKVVSLARLFKALTTFDGGLDYAAWKLERHTGRRVEVPDEVRRNPWLRVWPHIWRLWREGSFR